MSVQPNAAEVYSVDVSLPAKDLVYSLINHDNPPGAGEHVLTSELLILGTPGVNQSAYDRDTQISGTATPKLTELDDYEGTVMIYYDRLNIGAYLRNVAPIPIDNQDAETTRDIFPYIKDKFNLGLTVHDIVDEPLNWDTINGQLLRVVTDNLAWVGSVRFVMAPRIPSLEGVITKKGLQGLSFTGIGERASGEVYSYSKDTTAVAGYLPQLETGTMLDDVQVADLMAEATKDPWKLNSTPSDYNLYNGRVAYNGALGDRIPKRAGFTHAIEIEIDENYCLAVGSPLIYYYNAPTLKEATE